MTKAARARTHLDNAQALYQEAGSEEGNPQLIEVGIVLAEIQRLADDGHTRLLLLVARALRLLPRQPQRPVTLRELVN